MSPGGKNSLYLGTTDQNGILKYSQKNTLLSYLRDFAHLREFHLPRSTMSNSHHWPLDQTPMPPPFCIFPVEKASPISNFKALYLYLLYNRECQLCARLYKAHNNSTRRASFFMYTLETKAWRICVTSQGHYHLVSDRIRTYLATPISTFLLLLHKIYKTPFFSLHWSDLCV